MKTLLAALAIDPKNLIELTIGFLGILGAISSVSVYLATLNQRQLIGVDLAKLAARFQRLIDRNKVELGVVQMKIRGMENFIRSNYDYTVPQDFPPSSLPDEHTDFNDG